MNKEEYKKIRENIDSEKYLSELAHWYWEQDGCPDGEQIHPDFNIKIKDLHWLKAQLMREMDIKISNLPPINWKSKTGIYFANILENL